MWLNKAAAGAVIAGVLIVPLAGPGLSSDIAAAQAASIGPASRGQDADPSNGGPAIEATADRILRAMSEYLAAAREYTFHAEVTYDAVVDETQMIQYGGSAEVAVRRPGQLRAEYRGDERRSSVVIDGRTATIHDLERNLYSVTEVPAQLDAAVDHVFDTYGFSVPIADFVYADPYAALIGFVDSGFYVGLHAVDGTPCHHLAFSQDSIDWQIWIEHAPRPVPRKLVITYKDEPGAPQYTARMSRWDLQARLSSHYFDFDPPTGADEIEFMPLPADLPASDTEINQ
ncbi:MAG: DUF2092 domain-containing protein [Planctomycetota bacterium]|jgi:hypothetical protein